MRMSTGNRYMARKNKRRIVMRAKRLILFLCAAGAAVFFGVKMIPAASAAQENPFPDPEVILNEMYSQEENAPTAPTVVVDAGHGGEDFGTRGAFTGRKEKEVNLEIARKVEAALEENGIEVIMTREEDGMIAPTKSEDMQKRAGIIAESGAELFISIHQNYLEDDASVRGPIVFYREPCAEGRRLAQMLQDSLNDALAIDSPREIGEGDYQLLRNESVPSVIVECGFFSNEQEEAALQTEDYQNRIAAAILSAVREFLETREENAPAAE